MRKIHGPSHGGFKAVGSNLKIYESAVIVNAQNITLGDDVTIGDFVLLNAGQETTIGNRSQINAHSSIVGGGKFHMGNYVTLGYGTTILTGSDTPEGRYMVDAAPLHQRMVIRGTVRIGNNCFVGTGSIISPNCVIKDGSVLAALSFLRQGEVMEAWEIWGGSPARKLRGRPQG